MQLASYQLPLATCIFTIALSSTIYTMQIHMIILHENSLTLGVSHNIPFAPTLPKVYHMTPQGLNYFHDLLNS